MVNASPSVVTESRILQKQDSLIFLCDCGANWSHLEPQLMEGGNTQRLTRNDALTYLNAVKETFHDNTQTYDDFLNVMKDFKARRIDVAVVRKRVKELFKDHPKLMFGFNTFLPRGYEIHPPLLKRDPTQTTQPFGFDEAFKYVMKIKTRFEGNVHVYKSFLDILAAFKEGSISTLDVVEEVSFLFKGHADLMVEFFSWCRSFRMRRYFF